MDLNSYWVKIKSFVNEYLRVLKVTRKPDKIEFKTIIKVSGLGMVVIGIIGFLITMAKQLLFP
ncbi:protein translocase SEC61 complex subunit gamma [Candidatus Woesearchaeota archaeon]|nr:protein translocase SEC61 complex subunit gamma [Candidatus Woesearchaeota archaeon]